MNIEDQVCSLELSKRLKDLGIRQHSLFYYYYGAGRWEINMKDGYFVVEEGPYSAFTVAEIVLFLKKYGEYSKKYELDFYTTYDQFNIVIKPMRFIDKPIIYMKDYTEVNVRAQALIYLIENNLIEL